MRDAICSGRYALQFSKFMTRPNYGKRCGCPCSTTHHSTYVYSCSDRKLGSTVGANAQGCVHPYVSWHCNRGKRLHADQKKVRIAHTLTRAHKHTYPWLCSQPNISQFYTNRAVEIASEAALRYVRFHRRRLVYSKAFMMRRAELKNVRGVGG
jgi:hypothetical protein